MRTGTQQRLHTVPITLTEAKAYVGVEHRHHPAPVGHRFSLGVADEDGRLRESRALGQDANCILFIEGTGEDRHVRIGAARSAPAVKRTSAAVLPAIALVVHSDRPRPTGLAFISGWLVAKAATTNVTVLLTGETGAGKSILIDALQLALGARAESGVVREGAARCEIAAEFDAPASVAPWLEEQGFPVDDSLLLRRTVDTQGKSRAWVNGSPATAQQLRSIDRKSVV